MPEPRARSQRDVQVRAALPRRLRDPDDQQGRRGPARIVNPLHEGVRRGVYLDFAEAIGRLGRKAIEDKYGNLFDMYARITGEDPYEVPMRI